MKSTHTLWLVCAMLCVGFGMATTAMAATYTVNVTDEQLLGNASADPAVDGVCSVGSDADNDCTLREAIDAANASGEESTIIVPAGTITLQLAGEEDNNATGDLDLFGGFPVVIEGQGVNATMIDGNDLDRIFRSFSVDITVRDMTLSNANVTANVDTYGGAIYSTGPLTVDSVAFSYNAAFGGGAIFTSAATTVTNAEFVYNSTGGNGSAIIAYDDLAMTNSVVQFNTASGYAAIYFNNEEKTLTLDTVRIDTNTALGVGGVYVLNGSVVIDGSTFIDNTATGESGALLLSNGVDGTISGSLFTGNSSSYGGAIQTRCGSTTIVNSYIVDNTAESSAGAIATWCSDVGSTATGSLDIRFSTIVNNSAFEYGGILAESDNDDTATIELMGVILSNNTSNGDVVENCATTLTGSVVSLGYAIDSGSSCGLIGETDMSDVDPLLDDRGLADHGGSIQTIALLADSPAKNSIPSGDCVDALAAAVTTDARGYVRPAGGQCDAGAYEIDQTAPVVSLTGDPEVSVACHGHFVDDGATAVDNWDGVVVAGLDESSIIATDAVGEYDAVYTAQDVDGNIGTATRTVIVYDDIEPAITLLGDAEVSVVQGASYIEDGSTGSDDCEGVLSPDIEGVVDTAVAGVYTLTYTVSDSSGNSDSAVRTVTVLADVDGDGIPVTEDANDDDFDNDGVSSGDDCDDADAAAAEMMTFYQDDDSDGLGDALLTQQACENVDSIAGYVTNASDEQINIPDGSGIASFVGEAQGKITVTFTNDLFDTYTIFPLYAGDVAPKMVQYPETGLLIVLHPKGKKIALVNAYTGEVLQRMTLSKKVKYLKNTIALFDVRHDGTMDVVVTSKVKGKVRVSLLTFNSNTVRLIKKDSETLTGARAVNVKKTKAPKKRIVLKNSAGDIMYTYVVGNKYLMTLR